MRNLSCYASFVLRSRATVVLNLFNAQHYVTWGISNVPLVDSLNENICLLVLSLYLKIALLLNILEKIIKLKFFTRHSLENKLVIFNLYLFYLLVRCVLINLLSFHIISLFFEIRRPSVSGILNHW